MRKSIIMRGMILLHYILMVGMFVLCWGILYKLGPSSKILGRDDLVICGTYALMLILFGRIYSAYQVGFYRVGEIVYGQVLANLLSLGITYIMACALARRLLSPMGGFGVAMLQTAFTGIWTFWANQLYFTLHKPKRTMVIYRRESDLNKLGEIKFFENRWNVEKQVQWNESNPHDIPQEEGKPASASLNDIHGLIGVMKDYETVFVSGVNATLRNGIVKYCVETGKDCYFVPHTGDVIISGAAHMRSFAVPICRARRSRPTPEYLLIKRAMDITLSIIAVIATSPLMLVTAIAIWRYDGGPVLYKQVRLTKNGRRFNILKFRSMNTNAEKDGVARLTSENDQRVTPIGKVIRAIRVDELPQLFNILKGDMSIVGPRPERPEIAEQYRKELPAFDLRLQVKAGLTGYAQVYGRYNTEPQDKLKMDLMYISHASISEDLKLIFATVRILFMRESTSGVADGQTTASKVEKEKSA